MSEQQQHAIQSVIDIYGRTWKSKLLNNWINSKYPYSLSNVSGTLQQIRNEFGSK
ncbi:hypothetical protein KKI93_21960 [Xenorhabdus bovienii]|uniref:hypothetical protein n=1 Tax=Xenorhabdus bovienii TaxID=40576 RepID=UPI0023B2511C|nr:hypothetical protein [Xenorhabdus bovienii]MDE9566606.1 hypothetical protein [Xenorhabdus bovienii]